MDSAGWAAFIEDAYSLIAPYLERDPTKFCSYEKFEAGVEVLKTFCKLRIQSVSGQLTGAIPSTKEGQSLDKTTLVDTGTLNLSDMGTMSNGGPKGDREFSGDSPEPQTAAQGEQYPQGGTS